MPAAAAPAAAPTAAPALAAAVPAPAAPAAVPVADDPVPLAVMGDEDQQEAQEEITDDPGLQEVQDEDVPLAAGGIVGGLQHNFQHVCEAFASGFLPLLLLGSNRKRRKEVSELKKQIDDGSGRKDN